MSDETFDIDIEQAWPETCGLCGKAVGPGRYACPGCGAGWRKVPTTGPLFAVARAAAGLLFVAGTVAFAAFVVMDWFGMLAESFVVLAVSVPLVLVGMALGQRLEQRKERTSRFEWSKG